MPMPLGKTRFWGGPHSGVITDWEASSAEQGNCRRQEVERPTQLRQWTLLSSQLSSQHPQGQI